MIIKLDSCQNLRLIKKVFFIEHFQFSYLISHVNVEHGFIDSVQKILFPIFISPMMVPIILVAIGLFYFFVQFKLVNTVFGLVLGHSLVAMPLVLIIVFFVSN